MQVTLFYHDRHVSALGRELKADGVLLFGTGERAHIRISGEQIASLHFRIERVGDSVKLQNLAPMMAPVLLNNQPVVESELTDGDVVGIGTTQIRVQIRIPRPIPQPAADQTATANLAPDSGMDYREMAWEELPTGLVHLHDRSGKMELATVLGLLNDRLEPLLLANFRRANKPLPTWLPPDDNLLAAAPREVSEENSLFVIGPGEVGESDKSSSSEPDGSPRAMLLSLFHELRVHDAAVLSLGSVSRDEMVQAIAFRRGFFCSAVGLEMFLREGSRDLAEGLIGNAHVVLIAGDSDTEWALYVNPAFVGSAEELGLA